MKSKLTWLIATISIALSVGCKTTTTAAADATRAQRVERGLYLVNGIGCNDCHTPLKMTDHGPEPDMTRMLSGHPAALKMTRPPKLGAGPWAWTGAITNTAFAGPWGVSYAANLTPEQNSGLGIWTEDMFVRALRTGKHMGTSREILPPMPWPAFRNLTDEDLKAIYAYLRTIPPVVNQVPVALEPQEIEAALR
jgi:mono/diheme cytochrome c family protein